jgi:hypothetical protein
VAGDYPLSRALTQTLQVYEAVANQPPDASYPMPFAPGGLG